MSLIELVFNDLTKAANNVLITMCFVTADLDLDTTTKFLKLDLIMYIYVPKRRLA